MVHIQRTVMHTVLQTCQFFLTAGDQAPAGSSKQRGAAARANGPASETTICKFDWAFAGQYILSTQAGLAAAKLALEVRLLSVELTSWYPQHQLVAFDLHSSSKNPTSGCFLSLSLPAHRRTWQNVWRPQSRCRDLIAWWSVWS